MALTKLAKTLFDQLKPNIPNKAKNSWKIIRSDGATNEKKTYFQR